MIYAMFQGSDRRGALLEYFHETATAKIPAVKGYMMDQLEAGHKFLLFAHHQEILNALEEAARKVRFYWSDVKGLNECEHTTVGNPGGRDCYVLICTTAEWMTIIIIMCYC